MAERKQSGKAAEDEEVPAFFKNLGSGSPKPRQKFCGMFCPVEGSSENKTIDFDSLSVGRGSGQVVAQQRDVAHLGPDPQPPYSRQGRRAGGEPSVESGRKVEIRRASGKEALQNINDQVGMEEGRRCSRQDGAWGSPLPRAPSSSVKSRGSQRAHRPAPPRISLPCMCTSTPPYPPLLRAGFGEARAGRWAAVRPQRLPALPWAWVAGAGVTDGPIPGWGVSWLEGEGMGRGSILLKSSRAASDCSCVWLPHPFLMQLRACSGGFA